MLIKPLQLSTNSMDNQFSQKEKGNILNNKINNFK